MFIIIITNINNFININTNKILTIYLLLMLIITRVTTK